MPQANAPAFDAKRAWKDVLGHVAKEICLSKPDVVRRYMPRWWDETMLGTKGDYLEALLMLAGGLQIPAASIEERRSPLLPQNVPTCCKGSSPDKLDRQCPARQMAEALARNLVGMLDVGDVPLRRTAQALREDLLREEGTISLKGLLRLCWSHNVPVAHLADAPSPMPHAIATNVDGRCAIVLLRNKQHSGWLLFDLAHELGHVMLGHVAVGESHSDGEEYDATDAQEAQANEFAILLLLGKPMPKAAPRNLSASELRRQATATAANLRVDPQWIIVAVGQAWHDPVGWRTVSRSLKDGWPNDDAKATVLDELRHQFRVREVRSSRRDAILSLATAPEPKAA